MFVPPLGAGNVPTTNVLINDGLAIVRQGAADVLAISGDDRLWRRRRARPRKKRCR